MLIGVLSAHSWTQAQSSPPTNEVMIDIDTTASWEKIKKKKTHLALKTNLLYAATLTPNLGLEIGITPQISLNIVSSYNPWNREGKKGDNDKLVHWLVQPEVRYWLCEASNGHFIGIHGIVTKYNIAGYSLFSMLDKNYRYEGWEAGVGINYGYSWAFSKRWGIEAYLGIGVVQFTFDKTDNRDWCCNKSEHAEKTYFGPTQIGISLIYNIK